MKDGAELALAEGQVLEVELFQGVCSWESIRKRDKRPLLTFF